MSRLRVGGGDARGRRLKAPKGIRPTQGMVKAAMFNIVGPRIEGAHVLDLFAGSGAIGIEALSRPLHTLVEKILTHDPAAAGTLGIGVTGGGEPPFTLALWERDPVAADRALAALDRTLTDATVVAEHSRRQTLPSLSRLQLDRQRRYGDTMVTVFRI